MHFYEVVPNDKVVLTCLPTENGKVPALQSKVVMKSSHITIVILHYFRGPIGWVFVGSISILLGCLLVQLSSNARLMLVFGLAMLIVIPLLFLKGPQWMLFVALICLPFTQAPTAKLMARWRISELLAWLLIPWSLTKVSVIMGQLPMCIRVYLIGVGVYFLYTGLVGMVTSPFLPVLDEISLQHIHQPTLRVLLESFRGLAILSMISSIIYSVNSWDDLRTAVRCFVLGGAISAIYGVYQTVAIAFALPVLFLPGTLRQEHSVRPFSTFYEPTGFGSYTAVAVILSLYLLEESNKRWVWRSCLALNIIGLIFSLSSAGFLSFGAGLFVLLLFSFKRVIFFVPIGASLLWIGLLFMRNLAGEEKVTTALSQWWFENRLTERIEAYQSVLAELISNPLGIGQGNYLIIAGGAPGLARVIVEGGVIGIMSFLLVHLSVVVSIVWLFRAQDLEAKRFAAFVAAAYLSICLIFFNYIHIVDLWLWFVMCLPITGVALSAKLKKRIAGGLIPRSLTI